MTNQLLDLFLKEELESYDKNFLLRKLKVHDFKLIDFSSNDYLGLAEKKIDPELLNSYQSGSTGSRLTTGTHEIHLKLESTIAKWKKTEAALVFSSGYLANLGTIPALMGPRDVIFSDELNHSCINEGIRLSGAKKFFYKHNDIAHLTELLNKHRKEYQKAMLVTDSVFSMDGDQAKISEIVKLKKDFDFFIYVDEAHATGVFGKTGGGLIEELIDRNLITNSDIEIQMGTFSKAIGVEGAYIAGSKLLIDFLLNTAKTFMFSTANSPFITAQIFANLQELISNQKLQSKLKSNIQLTRDLLIKYGIKNWTNEHSAIFAIFVGDSNKTIEISKALIEQKFLVLAIREPTVSSPRLRVCISAKHSKEDIERLTKTIYLVITTSHRSSQ